MKKQIQIRIFPDGRIESVTRNIKGKTCLKYIGQLEKILEARAVDSDFTSEYYEQEEITSNNQTLNLNLAQ